MNNRQTILYCLEECWADDTAMIGDDLTESIVDNALAGRRTEFRPAQGGYNFDLAPYLDTVIAAASLLVSLVQLYQQLRSDTTQPEENLIKRLAERIVEELGTTEQRATEISTRLIQANKVKPSQGATDVPPSSTEC
jgi:hypothetical protein